VCLAAAYLPIDGADAAPPSARPRQQRPLPVADRFLTWALHSARVEPI
jgi:hypothetical protein